MSDLCYARGCDQNNIDCTCMYGTPLLSCWIHCDNCENGCKKSEGDIACKDFKRKGDNK